MLTFLRKYSILISIVFFLAILISVRYFSVPTAGIAVIFLVFSLAMSIYSIFGKHKSVSPRAEARRRIFKDILLLVLTIVLVMTLGGIMGSLAARYASGYIETRLPSFGMIAGFAAAVIVSFGVGFVVRWGMHKAFRS